MSEGWKAFWAVIMLIGWIVNLMKMLFTDTTGEFFARLPGVLVFPIGWIFGLF